MQPFLDLCHVSASRGETLKPFGAGSTAAHRAEVPNIGGKSSLNRGHVELVIVGEHTDCVSLA